jgi:uncharacterized repeat protein (TIGR02543 family)
MDKETLSNYGWILVAVLIGSIMLTMATPLGNFIFANIQAATVEGFNQTNLGKGDPEQVIVESKERKKVVFETQGGAFDGGYITSYQPGKPVHLPTNVVRDYYDFGGWYETAECSGTPISQINSSADSNLVFYADWIPKRYIVTYNLNGGIFENPSAVEYYYTYSKGFNLPTSTNHGAIHKDGYIFDGWYNATTNEKFVYSSEISGNITLYAKWK